MQEIWKDIPNFENIYQISNYGQVKALEKTVWTGKYFKHYPEKILKPTVDKDGYLCITLHNAGKIKGYRIHRLVAEAFIPNPENKPQVNHINGNKQKNTVTNLEWVSSKENIQHAYKINLMNQTGKNNAMFGKYGKDNPNSIPVYQIDTKSKQIIKEWDSITNAAKFLNIKCGGHIGDVCKGKRKSAYGYIWRYK